MSIKFIDSLDLKGDMISASSSTTQISISKNNHGNINFQGFAAQLAGAENTKQQGITWQINNYNGDTDYGVQAAIAVSNNGAVGTQMGFFTSNSYGGGPTERIRISADGSVGIGTSNMYSRLNVRATSHSNGISVHRAADTTAAIYIGNDGGNNPILAANNADMLFGRDFSGVFTERMRLTNSGNLGVGTSNPTYKLHVNGTSYINETLYVNGATTVDANLTVTGLLRADSELQFLRGAGSGDYSNYIRAQNYPSAGYTGATSKYWLEYGAKGGHHFVLNTDGGAGSGENEYDDFTIWNGVVDGDRLFEVTNGGNVNITGAITASGYNDSNWNTAYGWGNHASAGYLTSINRPMVHAAIYGIGGDANDYTEFGIYRNYAENGPVTSHNTILNVMQTSGTYGFQLGSNTTPDTDGLYFRAKGADLGAGDWIQIASRDWVASQGYITSETDSQTLSWNGSNGQLTISSGNTVDLDGRYEDAGAADAVNIRIDEEILPAIDAKVSKAGDQVTGTLSVGGSAAYDSTNLALDVQGHMGIWGDHKLYFKITSDNYNTWSTSQYANGSQHRFNAQSFSFTNEGYSSSVFMNINSSGVGMSRNLVLGNEVYGDTNAYSNWGARLFFNGSNTDAQNNYYIGTNGEDYGGNYSKLDLRWHTGIRMGAQAGYGGIRFYDNEDLNTRIMSIGESDNNIRIDNNLWIGGAGGWITDLFNAKANTSHTHSAADITSGTLDGARLSGTYTINVSGTSTYANNLYRDDNRTIAPSEDISGTLSFGFTSFQNDNSGPWADYLHLRSYTDASGGRDNLLMFSKSDMEIRLWQQGFNSAENYAEFRDVAFKDELSGLATTSYVDTAVSNLVDSSPAALNTLNELAAALGDDANFSTTVTNSLAGKLSTAGGKISRNGMLDVIPSSYSYTSGSHLELYTTDNHVPAIGFHRAGVSATTLFEEQGELFITKWNADGTPLKLWNRGDFDFQDFALSSEVPTNNNQLTNGAGYYSGTINLGSSDLVMQGSDPGDIVWKDASGTENHRIWAGSPNHLTYRNNAGTAYAIVHTGLSGYNASNWDTAYGWGNHAGLYDAAGAAEAVNLRIDEEVLPNIPTNNNQLTNGAGYITSADGGNANLLDGINSTSFLRSDVSDVYDGRTLSFGTAGNGSNTSAAFLTIEGNTDSSGEGSGRLFFREHNSTTVSADSYGFSIGYRGGSTAINSAMGNSWTGLGQIGNGEWGMWGHNNDALGALIMHGDRAGTYVDFSGNNIQGITDAYIADQIIHTGDTNTYMQFHAADQWRVVTGGAERLEVTNSQVQVQTDFKVAGSYTEVGNGIGSVSNDGNWNARLNVAGSSHARLDVKSVSDGIITSMFSHTGHGTGKVGTYSNHGLGLMVNGGEKVGINTSGHMYPNTDRTQWLGLDTNRWQIVFCEILDSAGQHEKNLQNPEGEKSVGEYKTGTVLVWKGGKNVPCTEPADHMRMGIAVKGIDSPLIQGAEPVLVTGEVNEGDYLVTSSVEGHAKAITPQFMRQHGLYDCVIGKALESGKGESHLIKTWINI
jgi:hypothetical protein